MVTIHLEDELIAEVDAYVAQLNKLNPRKLKRTQYIRAAIMDYNNKAQKILLKKQYEVASKLTRTDQARMLSEFEG